MDKIVLYGLGMRFEKLVRKNYLVNKELKKYEIVGFIDKKRVGENILFNNVNYVIFSLNTWMDFNIDKVVIISNKYLDEIESELVKRGFREEQIFTLDEILKPLFYDFIHIDCYQGKEGIEIGGPSNVFSNIYNVCKKCDNINFSLITTWWVGEKSDKYVFKNRTLGEIYILDATNLTNIADDTYDFVLTSNCLEHIANPIKALKELHRIMKKGGRIIIVVPKKDASFDHNRQFTSFEHLLKDFENNVEESDLSHLPEIIAKHDYEMDAVSGGKEAFMKRAQKNFENRCLHHHVFDEKCLKSLFDYLNISLDGFSETYSDYWIIGRK